MGTYMYTIKITRKQGNSVFIEQKQKQTDMFLQTT